MKKLLFFGLVFVFFGCNSTMQEKKEFKGKIKIVFLYNLTRGGISDPKFFLQEDTVLYYLNFKSNTIQEGLTLPYANNNSYPTQIGKENVFLNSNTNYQITAEIAKDSIQPIIRMDNTVLAAPGINKKINVKILNVRRIKEIARESGDCMIFLRFPTEGNCMSISETPVALKH